eukprot:gnl/TRDRNA2_/TRDRNA2_60765_c0_seq1.p1 gnl/TRDRNA2_/TRDRNA2_60765_c0~~gnl/TRDRNA2_/TRDRNA2_60765_c0_seq1.p1  ORF type:complete len:103 (-),score=10.84 gnl/TRDRNA2_/TRDRNA2_60765_c0_seq1:127-435(-)
MPRPRLNQPESRECRLSRCDGWRIVCTALVCIGTGSRVAHAHLRCTMPRNSSLGSGDDGTYADVSDAWHNVPTLGRIQHQGSANDLLGCVAAFVIETCMQTV